MNRTLAAFVPLLCIAASPFGCGQSVVVGTSSSGHATAGSAATTGGGAPSTSSTGSGGAGGGVASTSSTGSGGAAGGPASTTSATGGAGSTGATTTASTASGAGGASSSTTSASSTGSGGGAPSCTPVVAAACTGTLGFAPPVAYGLVQGWSGAGVAVADLDGDCKPDLAAVSFAYIGGSVNVLRNQGGGSFAAPVSYGIGPSGGYEIVAADFDGDGRPDLAVVAGDADSGETWPTVLLNHGNGTFGPGGQLSNSIDRAWLAAADLNGDGRIDLVYASLAFPAWITEVLVLWNQGGGAFAQGPVDPVAMNGIVAADLDGDGKPDLVGLGNGGVDVVRNLGGGSFALPATYAVGQGPIAVVAADLDGDGKPDLAVANGMGNTVSVLHNQGNGTFAAAVDYAVGGSPVSVAAVDLDGDGRTDLVVANQLDGTVTVLKNQGGGTFTHLLDVGAGTGPAQVAAADVDGDGRPDLVVVGQSGVVVLRTTCSP